MTDYLATRDRVEDYFDRSATRVWERLTSDAPVSRIRQTVREGRDRMRATMLSRLPEDLTGARVLDAGCGTGQMTAELAARGAEVTAVDIAPALVEIARARLPDEHAARVRFASGDMLADHHGRFDYVLAMDSMIYYATLDIARALDRLGARTGRAVVFTVAPRTPFLMTFWGLGQMFPRADRSPAMVPHAYDRLNRATGNRLRRVARISRGFYISECLEFRP
ncbi:MAG: magnesium protoporphyrin IX methyltransferase [Rhodobacter sp.]|nr:magnesium protoporphyrin IX methyltransferase [Rhodobacter sp.]MCA3523229.1 magnesium protoporphyrin IX methyltransferase [Rhodobacter sp.]MCA3524502.1 magnesium protoporphyrin IX methyltransferase [Rhodobacter sp.]MCA3529777.1 magnesium protoporphyrin IX methyltransferase [Rhodobacter sp.]MCA3532227.1 magnesium protoporphyrin IX methyltransferase [Rhodobacter sp.]